VRRLNGAYRNIYPPGVPLMVIPLAWISDRACALVGVDLEKLATQASRRHLELAIASVITAAAAALFFIYVRQRLPLAPALLLGSLFALGTTAYSDSSRGLFQHGPAMLLLMAAILIYERLPKWGNIGSILLGLIAGYSYAVRPANLIIAPGFLLLMAFTNRRTIPAYLAGVVAGVSPLFAFNLVTLGTWSSPYYRYTQAAIANLSLPIGPLVGVLLSPSRGLFVFSPFLLFVSLRLLPQYRRRFGIRPLEILLIGFSFAGVIGAARWEMWWGGQCYGPRLLTEAALSLCILLIPLLEGLSLDRSRKARALTISFLMAGILSVAIHMRGATDWNTVLWNSTPVDVDQRPDRVWSLRDAQFLHGL